MLTEITLPGLLVSVLSVAGAGIIIVLAALLIPRVVDRVLRAVDGKVLLDIAEYRTSVSMALIILVSAVVLLALVFTLLTQFGADTTGVQAMARSNGAAIGRWLVPKLLRLTIIVVLALLLLRLIHRVAPKLVRLFLKGRSDSETGANEVQKRAQTLEGVVSGALSVFVITVAIFTILAELGIPIGPVLAGVGIVGLAIGFGAQSLVKDVIAGIFILLEDQYRVGDVVRLAGTAGLVEDVNLRRTVLRDLDFIQHFIPNGDISVASNFTKEKSRVNLDVSVAYRSDLDHVIAVLNRVGEEMSQDEYFGPIITDQIKVLRVNSFDDSGIAVKVLGETLPLRQWETAGEFRKRVKRAFDQEGIEIPFPHRTLYWGSGVETKISQLLEDGKRKGSAEEASEAGRREPEVQ